MIREMKRKTQELKDQTSHAAPTSISNSAPQASASSYSYQAPVVASQKAEPEEDELEKYLREKREAEKKKAAESAFDEAAYFDSS